MDGGASHGRSCSLVRCGPRADAVGVKVAQVEYKVVTQVRIFHEDTPRARKADRVIQGVQLRPVCRSRAPVSPRSGDRQSASTLRGSGKREKSAAMGDEDDSPSIIVAEVYVEGNDIVLGVAPEWEY